MYRYFFARKQRGTTIANPQVTIRRVDVPARIEIAVIEKSGRGVSIDRPEPTPSAKDSQARGRSGVKHSLRCPQE